MKRKLLVLLYIPICLSLSGTTYYISPSGNDLNNGDISHPFATLNKAWTVISAGDQVYLRGGTYSFDNQQILTGKNGSSGNLIMIWAYPGETPILTKSARYSTNSGIYFSGNYFHFKGLDISGYSQIESSVCSGFVIVNSSHNIIEQINYHDNGAGMEMWQNSTDNLILNCDFHHNQDPLTTGGNQYGNADGLALNKVAYGTLNTIRGCRFWWNTDDGIDPYGSDGSIVIENCWSFYNGYIPDTFDTGGNGSGFKLGVTITDHGNDILFQIRNCLAYKNRNIGFDQNGALAAAELYNNTSYMNGTNGYYFDDYARVHILKNNISYKDDNAIRVSNVSILANNTFLYNSGNNPNFSVSDNDFIGLDGTQLMRMRKADGSLPDIDFLHLAPGSDLIDAGVDVGLLFSGNAPDIGAFEFQSGSTTPSPVFISSVVENATPSLLEMIYNLTLNSLVVPTTSCFNVLVNSVARTINTVAISGTEVQLTLDSPIEFGDTITVSYTKPANNPLQTISGGVAENIIAQPVTNNCQDQNKPDNPPVVVIKNEADSYSGFVYEIDASGSYDLDNDILTFEWTVPNNVSVSSTNSSKIQYLTPIINTSVAIEFQLKVTDGIAIVEKNIPINVLPYKPELDLAKMKSVKASSYRVPDYPNNASDGSLTTKWSTNGDNQWLSFALIEPYKISYLEIAFLPGQMYSSYFDIYASKDSITWEPILIQDTSCNFSGDLQVFDFPASSTNTEYSFLKYVGHGNSLNTWNNISEFKIFGTAQQNPGSTNNEKMKIIIYPNPAKDFFNISIDAPNLQPVRVRLIDYSGKIVFEDSIFSPGLNNIQIPGNLSSGVYSVELRSGTTKLDDQKLIINK
ncbi:MAG: T9SS type A sorting domain-containing protein [Bacteroidales bacterium]|jgi:uncharacterized repeat protein (TIGR02059 family)